MVFEWNVVYCGVVHCYCLLFEIIYTICFLEPLLYFYLFGVIVFHGIHMPIVNVVFSLANIFYTDYCLLLLRNWMWKTTLLLNVLLYVIISSLPNDEVMFLLLNYDLLKLGKSYKKAFFYLTVIYFSMYCKLFTSKIGFTYFHTIDKCFVKFNTSFIVMCIFTWHHHMM